MQTWIALLRGIDVEGHLLKVRYRSVAAISWRAVANKSDYEEIGKTVSLGAGCCEGLKPPLGFRG